MEDMQFDPDLEEQELLSLDESAEQPEKASEETEKAPDDDRTKASERRVFQILMGCIATWAALILLLVGAASAFGKPVHLLTVVEFIIDLFGIHYGVIYETLAKAAIVIAFIVLLVLLIKDTVWITQVLVKYMSRNAEKVTDERLSFILNTVGSKFSKILFFIIFCCVLSGDPLSSGSYAALAISFVFMVMFTAMAYFPRKTAEQGEEPADRKAAWAEFVFAIVRQILLLCLVGVLGFLVVVPAGYDLGYSIPAIIRVGVSGGVDFLRKFYDMILQGILDIIAICFFLRLMSIILGNGIKKLEVNVTLQNAVRQMCVGILVVIAISSVILCILAMVDVNGNVVFELSSVKTWFALLRDRFLPLICAAVAGIVFLPMLPDRTVK